MQCWHGRKRTCCPRWNAYEALPVDRAYFTLDGRSGAVTPEPEIVHHPDSGWPEPPAQGRQVGLYSWMGGNCGLMGPVNSPPKCS